MTNPYEAGIADNARRTLGGCTADGHQTLGSRAALLLASVGFGIVGLACCWLLLVIFAFASMVDSAIVGRQRIRLIADALLFSDGAWQIVFVAALLFFAGLGALM